MRLITLLSFIIILFSACDSSNRGCTDIWAINYDSYADYDDGSCVFEVDVVFALDANSAAYLNADDYATEVEYYIDNNYIGSDLWNSINGFPFAIPGVSEPNCYETGYTSFTYSWSGSNNSTFFYEAIPNGGIFQWEDYITLNKQFDCVYIPLTLAKRLEKNSSSLSKNNKESKHLKNILE